MVQGTQIAEVVRLQAILDARNQRVSDHRRTLRAPLLAIDHIIDVLELRHLAGVTFVDNHVCGELAQLSDLVPLTPGVTAAVDTRTLHAALLDLQEDVLEAMIPTRRSYTRQDDD